MAWTYHDFEEQATTALRITRLRSHISEVNLKIGASVSAGGMSRSTDTLESYVRGLRERLKELENYPDATGAVGGGVSVARFDE